MKNKKEKDQKVEIDLKFLKSILDEIKTIRNDMNEIRFNQEGGVPPAGHLTGHQVRKTKPIMNDIRLRGTFTNWNVSFSKVSEHKQYAVVSEFFVHLHDLFDQFDVKEFTAAYKKK